MTPRVNLFLIGAPKAGTTSIDTFLRAHPQVFMSPIKEPSHFSPDVNTQTRGELARQSTLDLKRYLASSGPAARALAYR